MLSSKPKDKRVIEVIINVMTVCEAVLQLILSIDLYDYKPFFVLFFWKEEQKTEVCMLCKQFYFYEKAR